MERIIFFGIALLLALLFFLLREPVQTFLAKRRNKERSPHGAGNPSYSLWPLVFISLFVGGAMLLYFTPE